MGKRVNSIFSHSLANWQSREETLLLLNNPVVIETANKVEAYWQKSSEVKSTKTSRWTSRSVSPDPEAQSFLKYSGPGVFFVNVNPYFVIVRAAARWSGFESISALRSIHIQAFESIASIFGSEEFFVCCESDAINDFFWDGHPMSTCIDLLENEMGIASSLTKEIVSDTSSQAWYSMGKGAFG